MWRRAKAACTGDSSQVTIRPPGARPAAMASAEYPPNVPTSRTEVADRAKVSSSRYRPSSRPTIMWGDSRVSTSSAASASRWAGGAVVCSAA